MLSHGKERHMRYMVFAIYCFLFATNKIPHILLADDIIQNF